MPRCGGFRQRDAPVGQCRAADAGQIHPHDAVFVRALQPRDARGRGELGFMALAVGDRQRVCIRIPARRAQASAVARVESAREQHHSAAAGFSGQAHCPRDTCAAGSASAPAVGPRESNRRAVAPATAHGWARTARWQRCASLSRSSFCAAPVVVRAIAKHELDLLLGPQQRQLLVAIAVRLARARCLDVDDANHARIHRIDGIAPLVSSETR